jgi:hypothetical protein
MRTNSRNQETAEDIDARIASQREDIIRDPAIRGFPVKVNRYRGVDYAGGQVRLASEDEGYWTVYSFGPGPAFILNWSAAFSHAPAPVIARTIHNALRYVQGGAEWDKGTRPEPMNPYAEARKQWDQWHRPVGRPKSVAPPPVLAGSRIRLLSMPQDPDPIPAGSEGDVIGVNGDQLQVRWDNGRTLLLLLGVDDFEIIAPDARP